MPDELELDVSLYAPYTGWINQDCDRCHDLNAVYVLTRESIFDGFSGALGTKRCLWGYGEENWCGAYDLSVYAAIQRYVYDPDKPLAPSNIKCRWVAGLRLGDGVSKSNESWISFPPTSWNSYTIPAAIITTQPEASCALEAPITLWNADNVNHAGPAPPCQDVGILGRIPPYVTLRGL
jgi:hypothetical protein